MKRIKIKLSPEEDAILYYEKTMGRNKTIRQRAAILYEAGRGAESMMEISRKLCCHQQNVRRVVERFEEKRMESLYACARGKRPNQLDAREQEITEELNRHPARSVPEVVTMLKEKFGICITETPVRIWLKKKDISTEKQNQYRQKQMKKHRDIL